MKNVTKWLLPALLIMLIGGLDLALQAQDLHPSRRKSPLGISRASFGDTYVKVHYGRPYARERAVFGELVPFGEVWRTGANEGTEFTTTKAIKVGGKTLPAGTYSLFTVPGETSWEIRFSPQLGLWATGMLDTQSRQFTPNIYDESQDVVRVNAPATRLGDEQDVIDQFTIELMSEGTTGTMEISWERTIVSVPISSMM